MLIMLGAGMAMLAAILLFPDSELGRGLRRALIEAPARGLNRFGPGQVLFYATLGLLGLTLAMLFEAEGMRVFGLMLPETVIWFALFDVGVFIDALLITGAVLASNGLRVVRTRLQAAARHAPVVARRIAGRARRVVRPAIRPGGRTDDDGPAWAGQAGYLALSMA